MQKKQKNILYSYLKHLVEKGQTKIDASQFKIQGDIKIHQNYALIALPMVPSPYPLLINQMRLTVTENHITIPIQENPQNSQSSQYHYTAILQSTQRSQYQLHVFFNSRGALVDPPQLKEYFVKSKQVGKTILLDEITQEQLTQLALRVTQMIVPELFENRMRIITLLINEYNQESVVCDAFSMQIDTQPQLDDYLLHLRCLSNIAQSIAALEQENFYNNKYVFLKKMIAYFSSMQKSAAGQSMAADPHPSQSTTDNFRADADLDRLTGIGIKIPELSIDLRGNSTEEASCFVDAVPESSCTSVYTPVLRSDSPRNRLSSASFRRGVMDPVVSMSDQEKVDIEKLEDIWNAFEQTPPDDQYPTHLRNILRQCHDKMLILQETLNVNPYNLSRMFHLVSVIESRIKKVLVEYLNSNNLLFANQFTEIQDLLTEDQIIDAIQKNQADVLDYLLTKGNFDINAIKMRVDDGSLVSLATFCFIKHSKPDLSFSCLDVLIKHNINILDIQHNGLPLAFHMESSPYLALSTTLAIGWAGESAFYKRSIDMLELYLRENPDAPQESDIQQVIAKWAEVIDHLKLDAQFKKSKAAICSDLEEKIKKTLAEDQINQAFHRSENYLRLMGDPLVKASEAKIQELKVCWYRETNKYIKMSKMIQIFDSGSKYKVFDALNPKALRYELLTMNEIRLYSTEYQAFTFEELKKFTLAFNAAYEKFLISIIELAQSFQQILQFLSATKSGTVALQSKEHRFFNSRLTVDSILADIPQKNSEIEQLAQLMSIYKAKKYQISDQEPSACPSKSTS